MYFIFQCLKCGEKKLFIADYFILEFPTMVEYWRKILKNLSFREEKVKCVTNTLIHGINIMKHHNHQMKDSLAS